MNIFQSDCDSDLTITSPISKSPDLNPLGVDIETLYNAKTNQHCQAEHCLVIDMK